MSALLIFNVPGSPRGKGRPRVTKRGHAFTDAKTMLYENWVAVRAAEAHNGKGLLEGPLRVRIVARIERPKTRPKKYRHPDKRPDLDNIIKAILDGIDQAAVWRDDAQVCEIMASKVYATGTTSVEVEIRDLP